MSEKLVREMANMVGGQIEEMQRLPDGSGFAMMSMPLPEDHWLTKPGIDEPPAPLLMGKNDPGREEWVRKIRMAAKYAIRAATMNGKEEDFDPDAMVNNFIIGMLGYHTPDGRSHL